jgi:hypothetical protein
MFMLEKVKKHGLKIFVFLFNALLAVIAVLIIREKDQTRLLENSQKEIPPNANEQNISLPSFESSVSTESLESDSVQADVAEPSPADNSTIAPVAPIPAPKPVSTPDPAVSAPANSTSNTLVPAPAPAAKPSNAKTKTS